MCLFVILSIDGFSQLDDLGIDAPWNKGSIDLTTGEKLAGFIQNNERLHLIRYKPNLSNDDGVRLVGEQDIVIRNIMMRKLKLQESLRLLAIKLKPYLNR